jgi:hypothetical protein
LTPGGAAERLANFRSSVQIVFHLLSTLFPSRSTAPPKQPDPESPFSPLSPKQPDPKSPLSPLSNGDPGALENPDQTTASKKDPVSPMAKGDAAAASAIRNPTTMPESTGQKRPGYEIFFKNNGIKKF